MLQIHMFTASHEEGYTFHHTIDVSFSKQFQILEACMNVLGNMHTLFDIDVNVVVMENKKMDIQGKEVEGVLITSSELPYSCFAEGAGLRSEKPILFDPNAPDHCRVSEVVEC